MRIPNSEHEARDWRIRAIAPDFTLEDVWALPAEGDAGDFGQLVDLAASFDATDVDSAAARALWQLRDQLGRWLDLGRIAAPADADGALPIPDTREGSLSARLPPDLRGSAAGVRFRSLPFVPVYRTDDEFVAEVSNRTVHALMHLGWAAAGDGRYRGEMAVYVKPRGTFGAAYLAAIRPFRHLIVYPALTRAFRHAWEERRGASVPSPAP